MVLPRSDAGIPVQAGLPISLRSGADPEVGGRDAALVTDGQACINLSQLLSRCLRQWLAMPA